MIKSNHRLAIATLLLPLFAAHMPQAAHAAKPPVAPLAQINLAPSTSEPADTPAVNAQTAIDPMPGISQEELQQLAADAARNRSQPDPTEPALGLKNSLNFLTLLIDGGPLMIPIAMMSLLVVAISLERLFATRRGLLLPGGLRREIRRASLDIEDVSPQSLFATTEKYPSVAGRILQDVLLKAGRPISEVEAALNEGSQREADYLYSNVRWLSLAASVTPLIGLLGTVWGMIIAFYNTTQLGAGMNKAEFLAEGIYVALVTTLGGLAVAIPAAIFAHHFEGRITKMLAQIEAEVRRVIPCLEAIEGKTRFDISARGFTQRKIEEQSVDGKHRTESLPPLATAAPQLKSKRGSAEHVQS